MASGCWSVSGRFLERPDPFGALSAVAQNIRRALEDRGASFFSDLVAATGHLPAEVEEGLWELVAAGLVTADGFDNLRALMDPRRRRAKGRERARRPRHAAGRWSLLRTMRRPWAPVKITRFAFPHWPNGLHANCFAGTESSFGISWLVKCWCSPGAISSSFTAEWN